MDCVSVDVQGGYTCRRSYNCLAVGRVEVMPDERGLSGSSFSCEKQMASGLEVIQCPLETGRDDQSMLGTFSVNCGASSLGILFVRLMNRSRGSASIWLPCGSR